MSDDIEELARLLPAPVEADLAPDRHRLLKEHMVHEIEESVRNRRAHPRRLLAWKWGLGGAASAVAATVAFVLFGGPPTTPAPVPAPPKGSAAAAPRDVLLVAATNALKTKSTGRYFVTRIEHGYVFAAHGYDVLGRRYTEDWEPRSAKNRPWGIVQHLGAAPFGPGSEAAWRADGSPSSWILPASGKNPDPTRVDAAAGPRRKGGTIGWQSRDGKVVLQARSYVLAGQIMTAETMATLPTDATGLRTWLTKRYKADPDPEMTVQDRLIEDALDLLAEMPVTARVRSAAYRMLAGLDAVKPLPDATDQRGRTGSAVAIPVKYEDDVTTLRVIFDHDSGNVLSIEQLTAAGKLRGYALVVDNGWTDEQPPAE
jgi:hypothetical protein